MTTPPPNPLWEYTPPRVSKCGRYVRMDAMQWPMALELYAAFKVKPIDAAREHAEWRNKGKRK